ncbi:MAG: putative transposase [candidate division NC10 bacterium]|nr:putative transposase [candidate division NC10 bacterium]
MEFTSCTYDTRRATAEKSQRRYVPEDYRSKMHTVLKRNFEAFSACDWLAALTAHIPNAGEHLVRYYGWYSNVNRGKRRKTQKEGPATIEEFSEVSDFAAKRA